jgi:hypothetical protein
MIRVSALKGIAPLYASASVDASSAAKMAGEGLNSPDPSISLPPFVSVMRMDKAVWS